MVMIVAGLVCWRSLPLCVRATHRRRIMVAGWEGSNVCVDDDEGRGYPPSRSDCGGVMISQCGCFSISRHVLLVCPFFIRCFLVDRAEARDNE